MNLAIKAVIKIFMGIESFYVDANEEIRNTHEHYIALFICTIIGFFILYVGKRKWDKEQQFDYAAMICGFLFFLQLFKTCIRLILGNFDKSVDLPLQVCNLMPLALYFAFKFRSKNIFSIFFFWIMCGTLQANFTPTLYDHFPHYESIRYWLTHAIMPFMAVYGLMIIGWKITFKDAIMSWISMTLGAYLMYWINKPLTANYWFVNQKPQGKTIYDLLGQWPDYMFQLVPIALTLFVLLFIIVKGIEILSKKVSSP
jgi:hypothetical integral membrane protein (TIGR02206 family)